MSMTDYEPDEARKFSEYDEWERALREQIYHLYGQEELKKQEKEPLALGVGLPRLLLYLLSWAHMERYLDRNMWNHVPLEERRAVLQSEAICRVVQAFLEYERGDE